MTEKSHVGMAYHVCPVCGLEHDPVVLLHRYLRKTLTDHEFAGWAMCPEHKAKRDEGYIALVECEERPSPHHEIKRTGNIAHLRAEVWPRFFDRPVPEQGICFVQVGLLQKLEEMISIKKDEP